MKLILFPLVVMLFTSIMSGITSLTGSATVKTPSNGGISGLGTSFTFTLGVLAIGGILIAVVVLMGVNVVGSGLSAGTGRVTAILLVYMGLWGILTLTGAQLILDIPVIGVLIYLSLSIMYVVGVGNALSRGSG